jgi:hypothetical protein
LPLLRVVIIAVALIAVLILIGLFIWWWWEWRGMGGLSPIARAYARLERYIPLIGLQLSDDQTPAERRQRIVRDLPDAQEPVTTITDMYSAERYGNAQRHPAEAAQQASVAQDAWGDTRGSILRRWLTRLVMPWRRSP